MTDSAQHNAPPFRPLSLFGVAVTGVFAGAALGAVTNAINGWVSPQYFVQILGWRDIDDVWRASVAQGILEGLLFGVLFSLVFTAGVGIISRAACSYRLASRYLLAIVSGAFACWLIGGGAAMGLASLSPEFYRSTFIGVPAETGPMLAYAWVGGSIWGVQFGALVCVVLGLVVLRAKWRLTHGTLNKPLHPPSGPHPAGEGDRLQRAARR